MYFNIMQNSSKIGREDIGEYEKTSKTLPKLWPLFWNALLPKLYLDFWAPLLMCLLKLLNIELGVHWVAFNLHAFIFF